MYNLKKLLKEPEKRVFATADIESRKWIYFVVLGFYDGTTYREFRSMTSFIKFLRNPPHPIPKEIFFHFGGKFDFMFLLREARKHSDIEIQNFIPRGSLVLSFDLSFSTHSYTIRDSSALLSFGLKTLTNSFDVPVKKGEWNHTKTKKWTPELSDYLKSDTIGLYQVLDKFQKQPIIESSGMATTTASQALRVFRKHFLDCEIIPHNQYSYKKAKLISEEKLCRQSYFGGRTEIFRPLTSEKIYEYDVNSLYPYVMRENIFPVSGGLRTKSIKKQCLGIYTCEVEAPENLNVPVLGIIHKGKYIFPLGKFSGTWCSAELDYASSLGYKIKCIEGFYFLDSRPIFKKYIDYFYDLRLQSPSGSVDNTVAKLMMNALYGRLGMNPIKEELSFELRKGVKPSYEVRVGNRVQEIFKGETELESFHKVAIASFVTSYARIHMHKNFYHTLGDELFYTDTDSIFTTRRFSTSAALGDLKLVREYEDGACFLLPKTYFAKGTNIKRVMKGFPSDKIKDFTIEDFQRALEGELKRMKVEVGPKFATFKQAVKQGKFLTMTKPTTKQLRSKYTKRELFKQEGQWFSRPLSL